MAVAGIQLSINTDELRSLRDNIRAFFPKADAADVLGDAIEKAIYPMYQRLREVTPVGPTGNLKRAVAQKVVKYRNTGVAVGIVGYQRAGAGRSASAAGGSVQVGPDRGFHQWWLEFGTKERVIDKPTPPKSYSRSGYSKPGFFRKEHPVTAYVRQQNGKSISVRASTRKAHPVSAHAVSSHNVTPTKPAYYASSYNELGQFSIERIRGTKGFSTNPAYPRAFFKKSSTPIRIPAMPVGGNAGRPPVLTAFNDTQSRVAEYLQRELSLSLGEAWAALRVRDSGSITGTDTLGPG
jgi:hypothetical protein